MANTSGSLRLGGINSGFDTEAIVNALTASTKLKITKNQRKIKGLEAQQTAYRDVISKFDAFKKKYFDILNPSTYLKSPTMFNQYKATSSYVNKSGDTVTGTPAGVSISSSSYANAGSYDVKVTSAATQATMKSTAFGANTTVGDLENLTEGSTYGMSVSLGGVSKTITFEAGADKEATIENLNKALQKFGKSSTTDSTGKGLIYVDDAGKLVSVEKKIHFLNING